MADAAVNFSPPGCPKLPSRFAAMLCLVAVCLVSGCGKMIAREATTQLLISDSVDRAIAGIDFSDLSGKKIYFDTTYLQPVKEVGFVNAPYVIGSLRQQMISSGCLLQDTKDTAEFIVEGRVGALGADQHEVIYGVPANNLLNAASSVVSTMPQLPTVPEISVAKKDDQMAAAKLALIAYDRETREPVWQSGIAQSRSTAHSEWLLGAGPFQRGTIYRHKRFAGTRGVNLPLLQTPDDDDNIKGRTYFNERRFAYFKQQSFVKDQPAEAQAAADGEVVQAAGEAEQKEGDPSPEAIQPSDDAKPIPAPESKPTSDTDAGVTNFKSPVYRDEPQTADVEGAFTPPAEKPRRKFWHFRR